MLKISQKSPSLAGTGGAPTNPPVAVAPDRAANSEGRLLGIAWIHGELSAVAVHRGGRTGSWIHSAVVDDMPGFRVALRTLVERTEYTGTQVSLILAHPKLTQKFLEVPNDKGGATQRALERQVEQGKPFPGPARWVAQPTLPTKSSGGTIVHILPRELLNQIGECFLQMGLTLASVVPASEGIRALVKVVPSNDDEVLLFASAMPSATLMVLVRSDGFPMLVRSVPENWTRDPGRVSVDINRTLLFVQQQFERTVGGIWLQGPDAAVNASAMAGGFQVPVRPVPGDENPLFWAQAALQVGARHPLNLVTGEQKREGSRRMVLGFSIAVGALLLVVALGLSLWVQFVYRQESIALGRLRIEEEALLKRHTELQSIHEASGRQETFLSEAGASRQAPLHAWVLGYLSESVPLDLQLTNYVARAQSNGWHFVIQGRTQLPPTVQGDRSYREQMGRFTNSLTGLPFHLRVEGTGSAPSRESTNSPAGWTGRVRANLRAPLPVATGNFSFTATLP